MLWTFLIPSSKRMKQVLHPGNKKIHHLKIPGYDH